MRFILLFRLHPLPAPIVASSSSSPASPLPSPQHPPMSFGPVGMDEADAVLDLLHRNFFRDEPLNATVSVCAPENAPLLEDLVLHVLSKELSVAARDLERGRLVGVLLNDAATREEMLTPLGEQLRGMEDTSVAHIFTLIHKVNQLGEQALFGDGTHQVFDMKVSSAHSPIRNTQLLTFKSRQTLFSHNFYLSTIKFKLEFNFNPPF